MKIQFNGKLRLLKSFTNQFLARRQVTIPKYNDQSHLV